MGGAAHRVGPAVGRLAEHIVPLLEAEAQ